MRKCNQRGAAEGVLPTRTADTMSEAIALSSPSGCISERARQEADKRLSLALFGPNGLPKPSCLEEPRWVCLRRQAAELRALAARGMHIRAYPKKAAALEAEADVLENGRA